MPERLLTALTTLAREIGGELDWFADRMQGLPRDPSAAPNPQPLTARLDARCGDGTDLTHPVRNALMAAATELPWTQSYRKSRRFDQHYLDNYGFVNVISPRDGLYRSDEMRISIGFWGEGLCYPLHAHEPEEWYVMLTGGCRMTSEGVGTYPAPPGTVVHHTPWQKHAARMEPGPLLACAYWRGSGLMDISTFYE